MGRLVSGEGGEHGKCITERNHYRSVYETPEVPGQDDLDEFDKILEELSHLTQFVGNAAKSWYSQGEYDLVIVRDDAPTPVYGKPLSTYSRVVASLSPVAQQRIYVKPSDRVEAERIVRNIKGA